MPMPSRRLALGAASLVFLVAGCGDNAQQPTVASAGGTPTATASTDAVTAYVEGMRTYVKCLRAEGVAVSDPDAKGNIEFSGDRRALKSDPKFHTAQLKCADLRPSMPDGLEEKPAMTAEEIETARRYAKCMQENGAPDFPDPGPDGHQPDNNDGSATWDSTSAGAQRATAACASIIGAPVSPGSGVG